MYFGFHELRAHQLFCRSLDNTYAQCIRSAQNVNKGKQKMIKQLFRKHNTGKKIETMELHFYKSKYIQTNKKAVVTGELFKQESLVRRW